MRLSFLFLVLLGLCVSADHYDLLRVSRSATDAEIKKAFKKLAKELHPDSAKTPEDRESRRKRFIEVSEAYEVLSDAKRRAAYDESGGRRSLSQGDDRNFLRYNLFAEFNGVAADASALEEAISKGAPKGGSFIVFFWSSNFPECIDAAPAYKQLGVKLAGTSITPMHFKCDDGPHICRQVVHGVPSVILFQGKNRFRFEGKFEIQALTEFVTTRLKHQIAVKSTASFDNCPRISRYTFPELFRQCFAVVQARELVAFEYSPCFDCDSEMLLAVDTVRRSIPDLQIEKVLCPRGRGGICKKFSEKNRAWTLTAITTTTYYEINPKEVRLVETQISDRKFDGRFFIVDFVSFIVQQRPSHAVVLNSQRLRNARRSNDSFAILMYDSKVTKGSNEMIQWSLLASYINKVKPYRTKRGRLRILSVNCSLLSDVCRDLNAGAAMPSVAIYPFGQKAKTKPPVMLSNQGLGWTLLQQRILEEAEPLHLYILDPKTYDSKVSKSLSSTKESKYWLMMFNAGQWCPPCNQMRPVWKEVARLIQKSPQAKKINVGLVECDTHKNLCNQMGIESYPSMFFMAKGRSRQEFGGNRDAKSIVEWAVEMIDSRVVQMHPQALMNTIQNGGTILVSFTAGAWCPPCTQLGPIFKQASSKIGAVTATVVNCDEQQHFCQMQGIDGFPTMILYHKGQRIVYDQRDRKVDLIADFVNRNVRL